MQVNDEGKPSVGWKVLGVLSMLMGFASISTDVYLPAMPAMARSLGASNGMIEYSITGYLVGFAFGQLLWGPISDRHGRRAPIAIGIVLFLFGSAGCALAGSAQAIVAWRLLQALGAAAGVVIARAMVRDLFVGPQAARVLSTLMVVMAVAPLVGPIVGGQVAAMAGWRAIFWLQVSIGLFNLAALYTLPETLPVAQRHDGRLLDVLGHYARLVREPRLMAYAAAGGFFYVGMFAYVAGTPFAYITYHHVPPQLYGLLFGVGIVGIMGSNAINARLVARHDSDTLLLWGTTLAAVAGVGSAVAAYWDLGGLWGLFFTLFLFVASTGFIVANSIAGALSDYPEQAGAVSALVGAFQYGSGVFGSGLVGLFADGTPRPLGFIMALAGVGACVGAAMLTRVPRAVRLAA